MPAHSARSHGAGITFVRMIEDSRCPTDVVCIWAGNASIELGVGLAAGLGPAHPLVLNTSIEPRDGTAWDLRIALHQLDPRPASGQPPSAQEYVVRLNVVGVDASVPAGSA